MTTIATEPTIDELEIAKRKLAPEALAGDADAVAEIARLDAELEALANRAELAKLADEETAEREQAAAAAAVEVARAGWQKEKETLEASRNSLLAKCEKSIDALITAMTSLREGELEIERLGQQLDSNFNAPRTMGVVESRLTRRLLEVGIRNLGILWNDEGMAPLLTLKGKRG